MPRIPSVRGLVITGFALFAMFFGAGNLILPAMIGVEAGPNAYVAAAGFLITGVALPIAAMIAMATIRPGEVRLADRMGSRLGLVLTTLIFLSTGMLYAIPRVAAVSYEMALAPVVGSSRTNLFLYTAAFFAVTFLAALRPSTVVNRIGTFLTPALLILLAVLVIGSIGQPLAGHEATGDYVNAPLSAGIIQGYFTMDAIAALVFGAIIVSALKSWGWTGKKSRTGMAYAALIAGGLLAVVYIGLVRVGQSGSGTNGAQVIAGMTQKLFGSFGQVFFGAIILLACLTTALGLLASSTAYFHGLVPALSMRAWLVVQVLIAFALANLGLETILEIVAPLNQLVYPMTICLVIVALLDRGEHVRFYWAYRLTAWTAGVLSVLEALNSTKLAVFAPLRDVLDVFPLGEVHMAWVVPALVALVIGLVLDWRWPRAPRAVESASSDDAVVPSPAAEA
ncbi:branched-chain amino acid transport system II carrier protein [Trueperella bialowiezensis]|uniref:LIV-II n=1 Tax=Trueperella bialowiezensis TaxID=312285 RepID=A0A3S4VU84_9ACTO|nr:branched-chain amino acid transport system II carrier protein [Trueperella bialowiezensis]VEI13809.1 LIV-II [Trueperella bialowiezensis]